MSALCRKQTSAFQTDYLGANRRVTKCHREIAIFAVASARWGDVMHFANYLVLGLLVACMLGAAAVILSRRDS
jgi:hypothetical protein